MTHSTTTTPIKSKAKRSFGSARARANLPAKAGQRKLPRPHSIHTTTLEARANARDLHLAPLAVRPHPLDQIKVIFTGRQPEMESLFLEAAQNYRERGR